MSNKIKFLLILLMSSGVFADEIQYQDGNTAGTPYGNVMMFNSGGTIKAVTSSVPLPVSASVTPAVDTTASGNITAANSNLNSGTATANSTVATSTLNGVSTADFVVTGTFSATLYAQVSVDGGTTWASLNSSTAITNLNTGAQTSSVTSAGNYQVVIPAASIFRVTAQAYTSGTAAVSIRASMGVSASSGGGGGSNGTVAQSSTTSGQNGMLGQGAVTTSAPTYTTAQTNPLSLNTSGGLRVDGSGVTQPVSSATLSTAANQSTEITSLSSIVTNTGNGSTSVNQTNGSQQSKITNGTNISDVIAGDSGNNSIPISTARKEVSFTTTTAQAVGSTDVSNYREVSVQINSQGGSSVVNFQGSNDNTTWFQVVMFPLNSTTIATGAVVNTTTSNLYFGAINSRYFRLNVTGISSGTTAGIIEFFASTTAFHAQIGYSNQAGTWTVGQSGNWNQGLQPNSSVSSGSSPNEASVSTVYEASHVIKSSAGILYSLLCYNSSATPQFLETFNSTTLPADGTTAITVPVSCAATSNCTLDFSPYGKYYSTGIVWSNSSTSPTKTIGSANMFCQPRYE